MTSPRYRHIGRLTYLFVSIAVAIATVTSAYGGTVNPDVTTIPAILAMTFPGWLILTVVLLVISLIFYRKSALIQLLTVAVAFPSILTVAPLNLVSPKLTAEEKERTFTFMTYNTFDLTDWTRLDEGPWERERWQREAEAGAVNKTISTIIKAQPDLMCAQEIVQILSPERSVSWLHFTEGQADTLGHMLPNRCGVGSELIFSRFPLQQIELRQPKSSCGIFCGATTEIFGQKILVVSIHLESIGLSDQDKALFKELTEGEARTKKDFKRVKSQLLSKLSVAFKERASQARLLREQIDSLGIENVIIAGDFNDIPGCYAMRELCGDDFKTAFSEAGKISLPTYHANRFYFHIDHILYRGNLRAVSYRRIRSPYSDHYPVVSTFLVTGR